MSLRENVLKGAMLVIEDTVFSSEGHFIAASTWSKCHYCLGVPATIFAVISGSTIMSLGTSYYLIAGLLGIIAGILAAVSTFVNPNGKAVEHHNAGTKYRQLRNETRIFSEIDYLNDDSEDELITKIKELSRRRDELNQISPQVPKWAYEKAKKKN